LRRGELSTRQASIVSQLSCHFRQRGEDFFEVFLWNDPERFAASDQAVEDRAGLTYLQDRTIAGIRPRDFIRIRANHPGVLKNHAEVLFQKSVQKTGKKSLY